VKVLVDMNLSPVWVGFLAGHGIEARHWCEVGDPRASDAAIMSWAREHGSVVLTHDLDFAALLAHASANGPSVLQVRAQDVLPEALGAKVVALLRDHADDLRRGAIVTMDDVNARVRVLPIRGRS
jgi:predicted nuclease of predicted toxin-antitoxin system